MQTTIDNAELDREVDSAIEQARSSKRRIESLIALWRKTGVLPESIPDRVDMWCLLTSCGLRSADPNPAKSNYTKRQTCWRYACKVARQLGLLTGKPRPRPESWAWRDGEELDYIGLDAIAHQDTKALYAPSPSKRGVNQSETRYNDRVNDSVNRNTEFRKFGNSSEDSSFAGEGYAMPIVGIDTRITVEVPWAIYAAGDTDDNANGEPIEKISFRLPSANGNLSPLELQRRLSLYQKRAEREETTALPEGTDCDLWSEEEQNEYLERMIEQEELAKKTQAVKSRKGLSSLIKR